MDRNLAHALAARPVETAPPDVDRPPGGYRHWRFHEGESGVFWLLFDKAGSRVNTLDQAVFAELDRALGEIEAVKPRALVIRSAKAEGFAAGADLRMLASWPGEAAARSHLEAAHALVDRLEALPFPTIAVVHGHCLGGGLELALACAYRIARSDASFALPEVRVGLHPGLGGTARLARQIAPTEAMKLMLTGRAIDARKALGLGLVDAVCEERHLANAVRMAVAGELRHRSASHSQVTLMSIKPSRVLIARRLGAETAKRVRREHYPAPYALIELWREHGDTKAGVLAAERASFARLLGTSTAQNLIRVFFLREHLKSLGTAGRHAIRRVHVIGAGAMGGDIAAWCALRGCTVTVEDASRERLGDAARRAAKLFDEKTSGPARKRAYDRFIPDFKSVGARRADLVIEAVPERLDVKQAVYQRIEPQLKDGALLATNTSSLRLERLRAALARPERFFGLHFFNPVAKMELVEVVEHDQADPDVLATARAFVASLDRLPAPVRSAPGFLVNRALMPYLMEALLLLDEGVPAEDIDAAATAFGMPMGPIELADHVGLDVCLQVADALAHGLQSPLPDIPPLLRQRVAQGALGKKTGRGLYTYDRGRPKRRADGVPSEERADRLVLPMINACVACLREGVVADERLVDGAMVFATGFAPFRGGPLHYARTRGVDEIVRRLEVLKREHGERFAPDPGWKGLR
ncbi:MAG: 3-hydroxyacyl-CoA dehydrogenase NAD-binding domain-containing protein [Burkholderiales bacterium]